MSERALQEELQQARERIRVLEELLTMEQTCPREHLERDPVFRKLIADCRIAEAGKRESRERYELALRGTNDGIWDWDRMTDQVYYSPRWKEILGYQDFEIPNNIEEWKRRIHPEDYTWVMAANDTFYTSDADNFAVEYRLQHKDGSYRWILGRGACLRDEQGIPYRIAGAHTDITALRKATEEAEAATRAKSEFLANMSHEIRTPLHSILGMTDLLKESPLTEQQSRLVFILQSSGKHLLDLLDSLLDLSRAESGSTELTFRPFRLPLLLSDISAQARIQAQKKGLRLICMPVPSDVPKRLVGDPGRLRQVLLNLLSNAIKCTQKGNITLSCKLQYRTSDSVQILFELQDTGAGIPAGMLEQIFERFTQSDSSPSRPFEGSGLGLSICRHLVKLMGGEISVHSVEGQGSTFAFSAHFSLPDDDSPALSTGSAADIERNPTNRTIRILIAEDSENNRILLELFLQDTPFAPMFARNGEEAVELYRTHAFDLVLMDIHMPAMDGYKAVAELRKHEAESGIPPVPVIALSANVMLRRSSRNELPAFSDFLNKPIQKKKLLEALYAQVSRHAHAAP